MAQYDVFISYRRSDVVTARALEKLLTAFGRAVFLDVKCIPAGTSWETAIDAALRSSQIMIVLWSSNAAASDFMKLEWQRVSDTCLIIPLRLDKTPLPGPLAHREAIEMPVHERLIARTTELVRQGMSPQEASQQMAHELNREGIALTAHQQQAVAEYAGILRKNNWLATALAVLLWWWRRGAAVLFGAPAAVGTVVLLAAIGGWYSSSVPPTVHAICEDGPSCTPTILPEPSSARDELTRPPAPGDADLKGVRTALAELQKTQLQVLNQLKTLTQQESRTANDTAIGQAARPLDAYRAFAANTKCKVPELNLSGDLPEEVMRERVRVAMDKAGLKHELRVLPGAAASYWMVVKQTPAVGQEVPCGSSVTVQVTNVMG